MSRYKHELPRYPVHGWELAAMTEMDGAAYLPEGHVFKRVERDDRSRTIAHMLREGRRLGTPDPAQLPASLECVRKVVREALDVDPVTRGMAFVITMHPDEAIAQIGAAGVALVVSTRTNERLTDGARCLAKEARNAILAEQARNAEPPPCPVCGVFGARCMTCSGAPPASYSRPEPSEPFLDHENPWITPSEIFNAVVDQIQGMLTPQSRSIVEQIEREFREDFDRMVATAEQLGVPAHEIDQYLAKQINPQLARDLGVPMDAEQVRDLLKIDPQQVTIGGSSTDGEVTLDLADLRPEQSEEQRLETTMMRVVERGTELPLGYVFERDDEHVKVTHDSGEVRWYRGPGTYDDFFNSSAATWPPEHECARRCAARMLGLEAPPIRRDTAGPQDPRVPLLRSYASR